MENSKVLNTTEINNSELVKVNGGGFAYDVSSAIRFLWNAGPNFQNLGYAVVDASETYQPIFSVKFSYWDELKSFISSLL